MTAWRLPIPPRYAWPLLLTWCGLLFFPGLAAGELYRTEGLRALLAAEALRGHWLVPTLYGEPLCTKPPGLYIAIAAVSWPFGEVTTATARLPSALAATGCVVMVFLSVRRALGPTAGLFAGLILPVSFVWLDKVPSAEIDPLQVFWVTAALLAFLRAVEGSKSEIRNSKSEHDCLVRISSFGFRISDFLWWLLALLAVAGGFLTKWTAPAFFYGTALPFLWWRGRLRLLLGWRHLVSAALAAGVCLAWLAAAVHQVGSELFFETVRRQAMAHLVPTASGRPYPWHETLAHPLLVLGTHFPTSALALLTLRRGFANRLDEPGRRLLQLGHCWVWPNLLFWSFIPEPAARHSAPIAAGFTLLATCAVFSVGQVSNLSLQAGQVGNLSYRFPWRRLFPLLGLWLVVKCAFLFVVMPARSEARQTRCKAQQLSELVPSHETLYLFLLKDEGIMFYYGRPVRRLPAGTEPPCERPDYGVLTAAEWRERERQGRCAAVARLADSQGDPIVLVCWPAANGARP